MPELTDLSLDTPANPFSGNIRYRRYGDALRDRFGCRVRKVSVDAGLGCPNRLPDGSGGCVYCDNASFNPIQGQPDLQGHTIREQLQTGMALLSRRYPGAKFIAYFQSFTNTYAPLHRLRELYEEALSVPDVVGLSVGTRPDCMPDEVIALFSELSRQTYVQVELGLQSSNDATLHRISRGHTADAFTDTMARCKGKGFSLCGHMIAGLPGETRQDAIQTALFMAGCGIDSIKIHNLHLVKGTRLDELWSAGETLDGAPIRLMPLEEYVATVADILERLPATVSVQQLVGSAPKNRLRVQPWERDRNEVVRAIETELLRRDSWQGRLANPATGTRPPPLP